jgi:hypothetical protein
MYPYCEPCNSSSAFLLETLVVVQPVKQFAAFIEGESPPLLSLETAN